MSKKHSPRPWVCGEWTILDEDRAAQKRGEPYWTLVDCGGGGLCVGPFGRKALSPEYVLCGVGHECDGVEVGPADAALIEAAPDMLDALEAMLRICQGDSGMGESFWQTVPEYVAARAALAKAAAVPS